MQQPSPSAPLPDAAASGQPLLPAVVMFRMIPVVIDERFRSVAGLGGFIHKTSEGADISKIFCATGGGEREHPELII